MYSRRELFSTIAASGLALSLHGQTPAAAPAAAPAKGPFQLPPLPYAADALEPHIDAQTMTIHHDRHHAAYVNNLNNALASHKEIAAMPVQEILKNLNKVPEAARTAVRNNGGGHYNHSLFWQMLSPKGGKPSGALRGAMDKAFGSGTAFDDQFTRAAMSVFGSGWAWLVMDNQKVVSIQTTPNQDTPLSAGHIPLLGIDVWEHAYYLKYQNRRPEYVKAFFSVINWDFVSQRYEKPDASM